MLSFPRQLTLAAVLATGGCFTPQTVLVGVQGGDGGVEAQDLGDAEDGGPTGGPTDEGAGVSRDEGRPDEGPPDAWTGEWGPVDCGDEDLAVAVDPGSGPRRDHLTVSTLLAFPELDAYVLLDRRPGLVGARGELGEAMTQVLGSLSCDPRGNPCDDEQHCVAQELCGEGGVCIEGPAERGCVPSLRVGLGSFDGESASYRHEADLAFPENDPFGNVRWSESGEPGDGREADFRRAIACILDGCHRAGCPGTCPSFRPGAERMLIVVTDDHDGCLDSPDPCPDRRELVDERDERFIRLAAVDVRDPGDLLKDTGLFQRVEPGAESGPGPALERAIRGRVDIPVQARTFFLPERGRVDPSTILRRVVVDDTPPCGSFTTYDNNGDGEPDGYLTARRGGRLCWRLELETPAVHRAGVGLADLALFADGLRVTDWSFCADFR